MEGRVHSCGGGILSLVLWGPGLLCKTSDILQLLFSMLFLLWRPSIIIGGCASSHWLLGPMFVSAHLIFVPVSHLDPLDKTLLCQFIMPCVCMCCDGVII